RHGVLTREAVLSEGWEGGFAALYPVLRALEEAGQVRRGYFVDGLGGSQFALPGAVDRLRATREPTGSMVVLAATDPANPYGAALPWPAPGQLPSGRPSRAPGAYVLLQDGLARAYLERGGRSLITFGEVVAEQLAALAAAALVRGRVEVQRVDGVAVHESGWPARLREAGFGASPRGMVMWPQGRGRARRSDLVHA
ncbi:MAG: Lhr family helicase, partial [Candidatus Dormibacterales bacterium]